MSIKIKAKVSEQMKLAMKNKDKARLKAIRLIQSEFKQVEVDERIELCDNRILAILDKMVKQRRESAKQFQEAGRDELLSQENYEISVIGEFLPEPLTEAEITTLVDDAFERVGITGAKAMGQIMALLKSKLQGRADMGKVSRLVKSKLS